MLKNPLLLTERVFLIDDSTNETSILANKALVKSLANGYYHGVVEQASLVKEVYRGKVNETDLIRRLGTNSWNLGYARNHALVLAKKYGIEKALFLDDDLELPDYNLFNEMFQLLEDYKFVGTTITGMPDDSIVGHLSRLVGMEHSERMLSGGCLAFKTELVSDFFLNIYNEDWIWLYLNEGRGNSLEFRGINQDLFDPYTNYINKFYFQEEGEIFVEGLFRSSDIHDLVQFDHWNETIKERKNYLLKLKEKLQAINHTIGFEIISTLLENYSRFEAKHFSQLFEQYLQQKNKLSQQLSTINQSII